MDSWLYTSYKKDPEFLPKSKAVCEVYRLAPQRHAAGERSASVDEKTSIQVLERNAPDLPPMPGKVARQEFEYTRHGTQVLIGAMDIATGQVMAQVGDTRSEHDFAHAMQVLFDSDPQAKRWHIVSDNLNTHSSETLVRLVASHCGIDPSTLGEKYKSGVLASMHTRQQFLSDPSHKIVFYYTPKHASWLNQIEIWFSMLVKKLLRRASFTSKEDLKRQILEFIDYFNRTMAKPFRWTYQGKVLVA